MRLGVLWALLLAACEAAPSEVELDRWLEEARAAEVRARSEHVVENEASRWTLTVLGEIARSEPLVLDNRALEEASTTTVTARPPLEGAVRATYRGARLSDLVGRAGGPGASVTEITLAASDGFRATIAWSDATRAPIMLATHADGARLRREQGGPLFTVFPLDEHPDLLERYTESWWVYYVTHLIVGDPPVQLRAGERVMTATELAALPQREIREVVGYRVGWPSAPARVVGPTVRDVLAAAGLSIRSDQRVRVLALAPITQGDDRPTYLSPDEVASDGVILGIGHGEEGAAIPSRLGGPVVLAFGGDLAQARSGHDWLTFVNELRVEPAGE